jgi:hypothetical protein
MQIKTTVRDHLISVRITVIKGKRSVGELQRKEIHGSRKWNMVTRGWGLGWKGEERGVGQRVQIS